MDVKTFKLTNGVELVAELLGPTGTGYRIKRPLQVAPMRGPNGETHLGFGMWVMTADADQVMELRDTAIAAGPIDAVEEVSTSYTSQVTGLALPPAANGKILHG